MDKNEDEASLPCISWLLILVFGFATQLPMRKIWDPFSFNWFGWKKWLARIHDSLLDTCILIKDQWVKIQLASDSLLGAQSDCIVYFYLHQSPIPLLFSVFIHIWWRSFSILAYNLLHYVPSSQTHPIQILSLCLLSGLDAIMPFLLIEFCFLLKAHSFYTVNLGGNRQHVEVYSQFFHNGQYFGDSILLKLPELFHHDVLFTFTN